MQQGFLFSHQIANFLIFSRIIHIGPARKNRSISAAGKTNQHGEREIMYSLAAKKGRLTL